MKFTAKTSEFVEMFTTMSMKDLYNPIVITVKKGVISMVAKDAADTTITVQKFKGITVEDETDEKLVFDSEEMLKTFKLFKSDEEILINIVDNTIVVANVDESEINDVITIPQIDASTVDLIEFPYKITKGIPVITNKVTGEAIDFSVITATMNTKYLQEVVKRATFIDIHPAIYKINIDNNKVTATVGDKNTYQKSVETTFKVDSTGSGELLFGNGFSEVVQTLNGDITMNAMPEAPVWFTYKSKNNIVHVLIAPAMISDE